MNGIDENNTGRFDVIVVMGAAVWKYRRPSPALRRRLLHGVDLMKQGRADVLLVTGGMGEHPPTEAQLMKSLAVEEGVPAEKIVIEERGTTTFTSVVECVRILRSNNWTAPLVVSDGYHLFRTRFVFRCFGVKTTRSAAKGWKHVNRKRTWLYYYVREAVAVSWYMVLVLKTKLFRT